MARKSNSGSPTRTAKSRTSETKIDKNVHVGRIMAEEERSEFYCCCCGKKYTKQKGNFLFQIVLYLLAICLTCLYARTVLTNTLLLLQTSSPVMKKRLWTECVKCAIGITTMIY